MNLTRPDDDDPADGATARVVAFSELAGAVSRELADPMSIVIGRLEMALDLGDQPAERDRHLRVAMVHARRLSATITNLGGLGRASEASSVVVCEAMYRALELAGPRLRPVEVRVEVRPARLALRVDGAFVARAVAEGLCWVLDRVGVAQRVDLVARRVGEVVELRVFAGVPGEGASSEPVTGPVGPTLTAAHGGECLGRARSGALPWAEVSWRWPASLAIEPLPR